MKNIYNLLAAVALTACCLLPTANSFSQAPQSMSYQAVARDLNGDPIPNQLIGLRFSIRNGSAGGPIVYSETHTATTNQFGSFAIAIGSGVPFIGTFSNIDWGNGSKYLQVELDVTGGTNYADMGASQL